MDAARDLGARRLPASARRQPGRARRPSPDCRPPGRGASPATGQASPSAAAPRRGGFAPRGGARRPRPPRCADATPLPPRAGPAPRPAATRSRSPSRPPRRRHGSIPPVGSSRKRSCGSWISAASGSPSRSTTVAVLACRPPPGAGRNRGCPSAFTQRPWPSSAYSRSREGSPRARASEARSSPGRSGRSSSITRSPTALRASRVESSPQRNTIGRMICRTLCSSHTRYANGWAVGSGEAKVPIRPTTM